MAEGKVEFEVLVDASEVSLGTFGPYTVKNKRIQVPSSEMRAFQAEPTMFRLIQNKTTRQGMEDETERFDAAEFPAVPAEPTPVGREEE